MLLMPRYCEYPTTPIDSNRIGNAISKNRPWSELDSTNLNYP